MRGEHETPQGLSMRWNRRNNRACQISRFRPNSKTQLAKSESEVGTKLEHDLHPIFASQLCVQPSLASNFQTLAQLLKDRRFAQIRGTKLVKKNWDLLALRRAEIGKVFLGDIATGARGTFRSPKVVIAPKGFIETLRDQNWTAGSTVNRLPDSHTIYAIPPQNGLHLLGAQHAAPLAERMKRDPYEEEADAEEVFRELVPSIPFGAGVKKEEESDVGVHVQLESDIPFGAGVKKEEESDVDVHVKLESGGIKEEEYDPSPEMRKIFAEFQKAIRDGNGAQAEQQSSCDMEYGRELDIAKSPTIAASSSVQPPNKRRRRSEFTFTQPSHCTLRRRRVPGDNSAPSNTHDMLAWRTCTCGTLLPPPDVHHDGKVGEYFGDEGDSYVSAAGGPAIEIWKGRILDLHAGEEKQDRLVKEIFKNGKLDWRV
ncbi:hypothetical protein R3P38DRAFT_2805814 [Favolaschia claudopus]|uniref:Uncharacterized protein n=1 Tax=Favolaschia claudopus TaxID=2862362 RepID=A0AAV9ZLH9_9AGAR